MAKASGISHPIEECGRHNIEIVKLIPSEMGKPENLIQYVADRPGHDRRYAIDNTKVATELGWKPAYTFERR